MGGARVIGIIPAQTVDAGRLTGDTLRITKEPMVFGAPRSNAIPKHDWINLLLVQAAPNAWDADERLGSSAELGVSEAHEIEVSDALASLEGTELRTVLTGPDRCSIAIGDIVARWTGAKARSVPELAEVDVGLWEGLRFNEIEQRHPKVFRQWRDDVSKVTPPNGEPPMEAMMRLVGALDQNLCKLTDPEPGVGVVVRPGAFGILSSWIASARLDGPSIMWTPSSPCCQHAWHEVRGSDFEIVRRKVGA